MESNKTSSKDIFYNLTLESIKDNFISDFKTTPKQISKLSYTFSDKAIIKNNIPKKENLPYAKFALTICNILFSFSAASIKLLNNYKKNYNYNLFSAIRYLVIYILSYLLLVYKQKPIGSLFKIKNWKWFSIRVLSNYFAILFFTSALMYIRLSTATCLYMIFPIISFILAVYLLNEKFDIKYLYGCFICFLGCICFTFSESNYEVSFDNNNVPDKQSLINLGVVVGIFFGLLDGFASSLISISAKFLIGEMDTFRANLLVAFYSGMLSFICSLFNMDSFLNDIIDLKFIFYGIINGIVVFGGYHFFYEAIEYADLSKTAYINYLEGIINILYGILFFGESITFFDVFGFSLIIIPNVYFTLYS